MFKTIVKFFKKSDRKKTSNTNSKNTAKERLHLVLMQDRANVSADFLDLMRQEIIEVIKKYIDIDENSMDVRLTNQANEDGTQGAPALYANIPIINIKNEMKNANKEEKEDTKEEISKEDEETKKIKEEAMKIVEEEKNQEDEEITNVHNEKEEEPEKEETPEKEKIDKKEKKDE